MIVVNLDIMMAKRRVGLAELAEKVGISPANLSILKNNNCRAIRFSTLATETGFPCRAPSRAP